MPYSLKTDIQKEISDQELIGLTDDEGLGIINDARITAAIAKGDAIADTFYGKVTEVPIPAPVPGVVKSNSVTMGIYFLFERRNRIPEDRRKSFEDVMALLKDIANGKAVLPPITASEIASGNEVNFSGEKRKFTRKKMSGF